MHSSFFWSKAKVAENCHSFSQKKQEWGRGHNYISDGAFIRIKKGIWEEKYT